jgi:hypothetical protein
LNHDFRNLSRVLLWSVLGLWLLAGQGEPGFAQQAGRDPAPGQSLQGGTTFVDTDHPVTSSGTLDLWRAASTQGTRVMLKVYRPDGDRLVLVGTSPLETVPAGEVATFACGIPVARNDLIGCFCPDSSCVDAFADGNTLSAAGDFGTSLRDGFSPGVGSPAIFAAGSLLADIPSTAATELVIPVVARTPGLNSTLWSTSLELQNTADRTADVALFFNRSEIDNTVPAASAQIVIGPRGMVTIDDLLIEAFGLGEAAGSVDIVSSEAIFAHARIANYGGAAGSYGQAVPAVPVVWALGEDTTPGTNPEAGIAQLFECREDADFRCNLGIASVASVPLRVNVTAWNGSDPVGTPLSLELEAFSHTQVNRLLQQMGIASAGGTRLEVAADAGSRGRFFAYISRIDNRSGDAVFLLGDRESTLP